MRFKSQKGSITIFVLVALLFYTAFLLLMYAANTNKFKTISEKSEILKGIYEKNTSDESINNIYNKKNTEQLIAGIEKISLPAEYQQVAYLESTGTQYIDTKFYAQKTVNHKYVFNFRLDQILDHSQTVIGHDLNDLRVESNGYFMGNESYQYIGLARHTVSIEIVSNNSEGSTHTITTIMDGSQRVERTSSYWPKATTLVTIFTNSYSKHLNNRMIVGKVFEAKIYENNIMIRNYIPCYCTATVTDANGTQCPSGTKGLYDLVHNQFYTNQGSGDDFIAGPDID